MYKYTLEEIDKALRLYQNGDKEVTTLLIDMFKDYIDIYVNLLKYNKFDIGNGKVHRFLSLFLSSKLALKQYNYSSYARNMFINKAKYISKYFAEYTDDDIRNDIIIIILKLVKKYNSDRPFFILYINKVIHYYLKNYVDRIIKSYLDYIDIDEIEQNEIDYKVYSHFEMVENKLDKERLIHNAIIPVVKNDNNTLDLNWINGITPTNMFDMLQPVDREILLLYYVKNKTIKDICNSIGYSTINTGIRRKNISIKKVKEYAENNNLLRLSKRIYLRKSQTKEMPRLQTDKETTLQKKQTTESKRQVKAGVFCSELVKRNIP